LEKNKVRALKMKAIIYCLIDHILYWKDPLEVLLRCLDPQQAQKAMNDFHDSLCGGHHFWRTIAYKILRAGYFWPSLFTGPFQQWGLDFIGEIHPTSSGQHQWILTAIDYFTKWIEAIPTRSYSHKVIIRFLEDIMSRFGCPSKIVIENVASFKSKPLIKFCEKYGISLVHSTPYYPQGNGLAESSNKILINIIKKLLEDNNKAWDSKMKFALCVDRVTTKQSLGISPFQLVYGIEVVFPTQIDLHVAKFLHDQQGEHDDMVRRIQ
jgi:hypothetical protein